jgi:hypothetical protein
MRDFINNTAILQNVSGIKVTGTYSQYNALTNRELSSSNNYSMQGGNITITLDIIPGATYSWQTKSFTPSYNEVYSTSVTVSLSGFTQSVTFTFSPTGDGIGCVPACNPDGKDSETIMIELFHSSGETRTKN